MEKEQLRMQMLAGIITEDEYKAKLEENQFTSGMKLIRNLTPEIENKVEQLKKSYPLHNFTLTPNSKWRPDRKDLQGTYTFSYDGPKDDSMMALMKELGL